MKFILIITFFLAISANSVEQIVLGSGKGANIQDVTPNQIVRRAPIYNNVIVGAQPDITPPNTFYINTINQQRNISISKATAAAGFTIYLRGNITTGANWYLISYNPSILNAFNLKVDLTGDFITDNTSMGSPGWSIFKFIPLNLGSTILKFRYRAFGNTLRWINILITVI
jgi:predicted secreted protein